MLVTFKDGLQLLASRVEVGHGADASQVRIYFTGISDIVGTPDIGIKGLILRTEISNCFTDDHTIEMMARKDAVEIVSITALADAVVPKDRGDDA